MTELWQQQLASAIRDPDQLLAYLNLNTLSILTDHNNANPFPCRVPHPYLARIKKGNPHDPLLRQVLPLSVENKPMPGYSLDPLQEMDASPTAGLLHKYHGRVLVTLTGACAIHCRYCFRRHFPYQTHSFNQPRWQAIVDYIQKDQSIHEVILSGGDPLVLKDASLQLIIQDLEAIPHITTLRIHSRLPIVIPARITPRLCASFKDSRLRTVMVVHCNHANEIDETVTQSLATLRSSNTTLLNQSVLLHGVNDNLSALIDLSHALHHAQVMPYYLHLLDKVAGSAHFEVTQTQALDLVTKLRLQLPGYLVPRLAQEIPTHGAKVILENKIETVTTI